MNLIKIIDNLILFGMIMSIILLFIILVLSYMDSENEIRVINMVNETRESIMPVSQINNKVDYECEYRLANQTIYYQQLLFSLERAYN